MRLYQMRDKIIYGTVRQSHIWFIDEKNLSENYLTDISFYGTINNVIWRNACDGKNMAGVVKWLTRRIVAPLRVGSSPTTRPIFFCLKSDIIGLHGGIAKR